MLKKILQYQFLRFLVVGVVNTIFGYSVYSVLLICGLHFTIASFLSTVMGILFNFKSIGRFVFHNTSNSLLIKFFMVYIISYFVNITLIYIVNLYINNDYISGAICILPTSILSYFLNKTLVYKTNSKTCQL